MNNSPRRRVRVQPPLRGRLAAVASPQQKRRYSKPLIRQGPLVSTSYSKIPKSYSKTPKSYPKNSSFSPSCPKPENNKENPAQLNNFSPDSFNQSLISWILIFLFLLAIANLI